MRVAARALTRALPAACSYFLLRESMLDSVLVARDKWMKPGGSMCVDPLAGGFLMTARHAAR